jgi:hypothetical protein
MKNRGKGFLFVFVALVMVLSSAPVLASNDYVFVELLWQYPFVYNAMGFKVDLKANDKPQSDPSIFTAAWLGFNLDNRPSNERFPEEFSQVGIKTDANGIFWFVYAEPGVQCLEGTYDYWNDERQTFFGCHGYTDQFVSLGATVTVSMETSQSSNYWLATVWETVGGQSVAHPVALINFSGKRIYKAIVSMEEGIPTSLDPYDPYFMADFYFSHPKYYNLATNTYYEWPFSQTPGPNAKYSFLKAISNYSGRMICPVYYGGITDYNFDPRQWRAGTYGYVCDTTMFPGQFQYIPAVIRD